MYLEYILSFFILQKIASVRAQDVEWRTANCLPEHCLKNEWFDESTVVQMYIVEGDMQTVHLLTHYFSLDMFSWISSNLNKLVRQEKMILFSDIRE